MSKAARKEYDEARDRQLTKNEARRIRTKVSDAQNNPTQASGRWPFELLQNAHDPGPRPGNDTIKFQIGFEGSTVTITHNGKPFASQDLAALLSGGSNKGYDDKDTTGRFGTGFLVTHALSTKLQLSGLLQTGEGHERFEVNLDRSGDEDAIVEDINRSKEALTEAERVRHLSDYATAVFVYRLDDQGVEVAKSGIRQFIDALPYIFSTCPNLGTVTVEDGSVRRIWQADDETVKAVSNTNLRERKIDYQGPEGSRSIRSFSLSSKDASSSILLILRQSEGGWEVKIPPEKMPRIFVQFPISGTESLPMNVLLNGDFEPSQERSAIQFNKSREELSDALKSLPSLISYGQDKSWKGIHRLAYIRKPEQPIGSDNADREISWWTDQLGHVATKMAKLPIVETKEGLLPATADSTEATAYFVYPRYSAESSDTFDIDEIYPLASDVKGLAIVQRNRISDWAKTADGWKTLGVDTSRIGVKELADRVRETASSLNAVGVHGDPRTWLVSFVRLLKHLVDEHNVKSVLQGLIPDQNGQLKSLVDLAPDQGVPESLKDIAELLDYDVRSELIDLGFQRAVSESNERVSSTLLESAKDPLTPARLVDRCLKKLTTRLPDGGSNKDVDRSGAVASARLIHFLNRKDANVQNAEEKIQRCPVLTADGTVARLGPKRKIMSPVGKWHEAAQPYSRVYSPRQILNPFYVEQGGDVIRAVDDLIGLGFAYADPIFSGKRGEVKGTLLERLAHENADTKNIIVRNESFSQIALLPQLFSRCRESEELARTLVGLVIDYVASHDSRWKEWKQVAGYRNREEVELKVRDAVWPAELLARPWIPVPVEGEETVVPASEANLKSMLKSEWLRDNPDAVTLLHEVFGISRLELQLLAIEDPSERERMEDRMALLAEKGMDAVGALVDEDPDLVEDLLEEIKQKRRRDRARAQNRRFGLAVQDAVQDYLEQRGLEVSVVDCGYDFDVAVSDEINLEDGTHHLRVGESVYLEVKATTGDEVRLTPTQASTASKAPDRFVLCVVDLRGVPHDRVESDWSPEAIASRACLVPRIGQEVRTTWEYVDYFTHPDNSSIRITRETELRYIVPSEIWEEGIGIQKWANELRAPL